MKVIPTKEDEEAAMKIVHELKGGISLNSALCRVLTKRLGTQITCYGGTPVMPKAEFRDD